MRKQGKGGEGNPLDQEVTFLVFLADGQIIERSSRLDEQQSSGQRLRDSISRIQAASSVLAPAVDCLVFP